MSARIFKFSYPDKKKGVQVIQADHCSGETPAGSNTFYWLFYLGRNSAGQRQQVARVAERKFSAAQKKAINQLYGWTWMEKIVNAPELRLQVWHNYDDYLENIPEETEQVWKINNLQGTWLLQNPTSITLHVMNNEDTTMEGSDFKNTLCKLWPDKIIHIDKRRN